LKLSSGDDLHIWKTAENIKADLFHQCFDYL